MNIGSDKLDPHTWLDEHGNYLYSYALLRVKNQHIAEDLVQETLLAAIAAKNSFSNKSSLRTWLIGILKHKLVDHFRRQERNVTFKDLTDEDDNFLDSFFAKDHHWREKLNVFENPESAFQQQEFWKVFQQCLSRLKPRQAAVFLAKEIDGMNNQDICKRYSINSTNQWVLMHRARLSLIKCLKINWID